MQQGINLPASEPFGRWLQVKNTSHVNSRFNYASFVFLWWTYRKEQDKKKRICQTIVVQRSNNMFSSQIITKGTAAKKNGFELLTDVRLEIWKTDSYRGSWSGNLAGSKNEGSDWSGTDIKETLKYQIAQLAHMSLTTQIFTDCTFRVTQN